MAGEEYVPLRKMLDYEALCLRVRVQSRYLYEQGQKLGALQLKVNNLEKERERVPYLNRDFKLQGIKMDKLTEQKTKLSEIVANFNLDLADIFESRGSPQRVQGDFDVYGYPPQHTEATGADESYSQSTSGSGMIKYLASQAGASEPMVRDPNLHISPKYCPFLPAQVIVESSPAEDAGPPFETPHGKEIRKLKSELARLSQEKVLFDELDRTLAIRLAQLDSARHHNLKLRATIAKFQHDVAGVIELPRTDHVPAEPTVPSAHFEFDEPENSISQTEPDIRELQVTGGTPSTSETCDSFQNMEIDGLQRQIKLLKEGNSLIPELCKILILRLVELEYLTDQNIRLRKTIDKFNFDADLVFEDSSVSSVDESIMAIEYLETPVSSLSGPPKTFQPSPVIPLAVLQLEQSMAAKVSESSNSTVKDPTLSGEHSKPLAADSFSLIGSDEQLISVALLEPAKELVTEVSEPPRSVTTQSLEKLTSTSKFQQDLLIHFDPLANIPKDLAALGIPSYSGESMPRIPGISHPSPATEDKDDHKPHDC